MGLLSSSASHLFWRSASISTTQQLRPVQPAPGPIHLRTGIAPLTSDERKVRAKAQVIREQQRWQTWAKLEAEHSQLEQIAEQMSPF